MRYDCEEKKEMCSDENIIKVKDIGKGKELKMGRKKKIDEIMVGKIMRKFRF